MSAEAERDDPVPHGLEPEEFCRRLEAYLCRKNDGHLVRIVGPAFEQVCAWSRRGVPLGVAERGIDRYFERYYAKGPRRRPVRIEFCEADVLDTFDEWRRATGVPLAAGIEAEPAGQHAGKQSSTLPAHLDRVIARLTSARAGNDRTLDPTLDAIVGELDALRASAKALRGQAREQCLQRLAAIDGELLAAARAAVSASALTELGREADEELAPFRARMLPDAYDRSRRASIDRLLRERYRLPIVAFE